MFNKVNPVDKVGKVIFFTAVFVIVKLVQAVIEVGKTRFSKVVEFATEPPTLRFVQLFIAVGKVTLFIE